MNDPKRNQNIDIEKILNKFNKIPIKYFVNDDVNGFLEYVNNKSSQFNPNATHAHKSYLNYCAMLGSVSCFKSLILKDAKIDNYTLEYASIGGDFEIFQIVEQKIGENPEIISNSLLKAIQCHNDEIAYYLIDKYSAEFPFLRCAECYNMKFFIYKLGNNETINDQDDFKSTALRASIHFEIPSFVSYLCNFKDINLNLSDNQSETPLMISSILGNTEIAKILIEKGADLNLKSDLGYSALMYCSLYNSISVTKLLIQHSALKHLYKDSRSKRMNAKDIAAESGHQEIVDLLK
ncbi:hypothetical protein TVAG_394570 [Trichomonas vaginalis G3]|uniref:Uncharacterized protein n=1 Tax=Trichomonas vaginalis (strain ATCC PRA-98 / G3) TaxID=412133 RepID=A2DWH3_TRIV3|nr:EP4 subtype prostaglandin E2 receptor binding [Trichomonas vaginalis G3]EAY15313.1 hypothetical protein TVAG_394570 [Trichomonas vaginalis G3]KAI5536611.1 EP4 subtype prostaglandin E2 receptor binding [Trichomonas vaginalis G3]|eukprot:XP_001327536.1 hypothetical protein [Trichomonas vaginalis G3]